MNEKIVLNTIAFKDEMNTGVTQDKFVDQVAKMGFDGIEIRNEYLSDKKLELIEIKEKSQQKDLDTFYSVNDCLIVSGHINPEFDQYIGEMKKLSSKRVKMNIGDVTNYSIELFKDEILPKLDSSYNLSLENNQNFRDSNFENTKLFFQMVKAVGCQNIDYCFDIANWSWLDVTANVAAKTLSQFTKYVHLKNVTTVNGHKVITSLENGELDWHNILKQFTNTAIFAFEYLGTEVEFQTDLESLKILLKKR